MGTMPFSGKAAKTIVSQDAAKAIADIAAAHALSGEAGAEALKRLAIRARYCGDYDAFRDVFYPKHFVAAGGKRAGKVPDASLKAFFYEARRGTYADIGVQKSQQEHEAGMSAAMLNANAFSKHIDGVCQNRK